MDYKKLYYKLCNYCKTTDINTRMMNRNYLDERIGSTYIYTENHHIIPKHAGGIDSDSNLVKMLPEEHFMAHLIRYNAYDDPKDFLAVRIMLNGFNGKSYLVNTIPTNLKNKMVRSFKTNMAYFREKHGWHTTDGRHRISESRKGTIVVRDDRGDTISVPTNHPNVVSGKWKHHTYGTISVIDNNGDKLRISTSEYHKNKELYTANIGQTAGEKNSRYSGFTDSDIVNYVIKVSELVDVGYIIPYPTVRDFCEKYYNISLPKSFSSFRFDGKQRKGLMQCVCSKSKIEYNPYLFNNKKMRNKINNKIRELLND